MIETILYLQLFFYFAIIAFAIWHRSPSFFLLAFAFGMITSIALASEGIDINQGWTGNVDQDTYDFNVTKSYETHTVENSGFVQTWYWAFFASAFVWLISAIILTAIIMTHKEEGETYATQRR